MFITQGTFRGKDGEIEAGTEVTAKDLGIDAKDCDRYVDLGLLVKKPVASKKAADKSEK